MVKKKIFKYINTLTFGLDNVIKSEVFFFFSLFRLYLFFFFLWVFFSYLCYTTRKDRFQCLISIIWQCVFTVFRCILSDSFYRRLCVIVFPACTANKEAKWSSDLHTITGTPQYNPYRAVYILIFVDFVKWTYLQVSILEVSQKWLALNTF